MFMMFKKNYINPKLSKYIKEENNKWLQKYSNNYIYKNDVGLSVLHLVKQKPKNFNNSSFFFILTSFITFFLTGYYTSILIK